MSNFPEVLGMVTVFFFLTLLPVGALLAAVLAKRMVDNALTALMNGQREEKAMAQPQVIKVNLLTPSHSASLRKPELRHA
jgi:hypothetical protein